MIFSDAKRIVVAGAAAAAVLTRCVLYVCRFSWQCRIYWRSIYRECECVCYSYICCIYTYICSSIFRVYAVRRRRPPKVYQPDPIKPIAHSRRRTLYNAAAKHTTIRISDVAAPTKTSSPIYPSLYTHTHAVNARAAKCAGRVEWYAEERPHHISTQHTYFYTRREVCWHNFFFFYFILLESFVYAAAASCSLRCKIDLVYKQDIFICGTWVVLCRGVGGGEDKNIDHVCLCWKEHARESGGGDDATYMNFVLYYFERRELYPSTDVPYMRAMGHLRRSFGAHMEKSYIRG